MKMSAETAQVIAALLRAQEKFPTVNKTHTARVPTKSGGEYSYHYADLADTVEATKAILHENGIVVSQFPDFDGQHDLLTTRVAHTSGEWLEASMRLHPSTTPQGQGSAITYARRYAYCAALGIVADEDDDGAAATQERSSGRSSGGSRQTSRRSASNSGSGGRRRRQARIFALCMANELTPATECSEILDTQVDDTQRLTDEQADYVLQVLEGDRGLKFAPR